MQRRRNIGLLRGLNPHEGVYRKTCQSALPQFLPTQAIMKPGQPMTVEMARLMGKIFAQENSAEIQQIIMALGDVDKLEGIPITKAFIGLTVEIGTSATEILVADKKRSYLILNPASETIGQTTESALVDSGTVTAAAGNSADINVAGVEDLHVHFDITAITGRWRIWQQVKDPVSGRYSDVQMLFDTDDSEIGGTTGTFYAYVGALGVASTMRFRYERVGGAASITFSLGGTRKKNVGSLDVTDGVPHTIYLGPPGVTTTSGYPLLEGEQNFFTIDQNVVLSGVAQATVNIKLFQLEV